MTAQGYVLAGGQSRRMGRDKALIALGNSTLVERTAGVVREACGSAAVVGPRERYGHLGLRVIEDRVAGKGPLSGIDAVLRDAGEGWALVVACDMPGLEAQFLRELAAQAEETCDAVLAQGGDGVPEPLCAMYHVRCLPLVELALAGGPLKVTSALAAARVRFWPVPDERFLVNWNAPGDMAGSGDG